MKILITGGAGFIGSNCTDYFSRRGHDVVLFDNLSRPGSEKNLNWLRETHPVRFVRGDVCDPESPIHTVRDQGPFDLVVHLAGQVAVTTSVQEPLQDFRINALGTLHLLEAVRLHSPEAVFLFASSNKVYGRMEDLDVEETEDRYVLRSAREGIDERRNLDFHSPYGCSKGAADQYCRDYARIYGLKTLVMRMSCIYGRRQFGVEDQGWVAWFCIAAASGRPVTIYGNGKQVRDLLHVDDLVRLYEAACERAGENRGGVFNVGGGVENTLSLRELIVYLQNLSGKPFPVQFREERPGDQPIYVSNISRARRTFGWRPTIGPDWGVGDLYAWAAANAASPRP